MQQIKKSLALQFQMKDMGKLHYIAWELTFSKMKQTNVSWYTRNVHFEHAWKV